MLELENICKRYTSDTFEQTALDSVSVAFRDNEFVAVLGPSGSGKTTLLNVIFWWMESLPRNSKNVIGIRIAITVLDLYFRVTI